MNSTAMPVAFRTATSRRVNVSVGRTSIAPRSVSRSSRPPGATSNDLVMVWPSAGVACTMATHPKTAMPSRITSMRIPKPPSSSPENRIAARRCAAFGMTSLRAVTPSVAHGVSPHSHATACSPHSTPTGVPPSSSVQKPAGPAAPVRSPRRLRGGQVLPPAPACG